ncbi:MULTISPECIES: hypothetical protein [Xanthomonas]|uniref:hypothetical protein n=1 Tax=Xanthomonas TaxID=338 RepID=UPI001264845E|nr:MULTISPECIES: hypothetical protein [Xanthomonas]MDY4284588.1 hypothetical protein [Xanthomonas sp. LF06-19]MDY4341976.1 hypothetical protein [Xanthomonas sp. LF07-6]
MDADRDFEVKSYQEIANLTLGGYQLIEALLKTYLRNYFNIAKHRLGRDLHFGFTGSDYDNAALGTLLKVFAKTCSDSQLVKDLQAEIPHRDYVAHQASLVMFRRQPCSSEELQALSKQLSTRSSSISGLLTRLNNVHNLLLAPYRGEPGLGA